MKDNEYVVEAMENHSLGNRNAVIALSKEFYKRETKSDMPRETAARFTEVVNNEEQFKTILEHLSQLIELAKKSK